MKQYFLVLFSVFVTILATAQHNYKSAIGARVYPGGLTYKTFVANNHALEGIVQAADSSYFVSGLYEFHAAIIKVDGLKWYAGPGLYYRNRKDDNARESSFGAKAVVGLDYKFKNLPVNTSLDWSPFYSFKEKDFNLRWLNLAVRYVLK